MNVCDKLDKVGYIFFIRPHMNLRLSNQLDGLFLFDISGQPTALDTIYEDLGLIADSLVEELVDGRE